MGKLRALGLLGALAVAAPAVAVAAATPVAAAPQCAPAGAAIGGVHVARGVGISISAASGAWSCTDGSASVSVTVMPANPLAALLVDGALGSAAGQGSVTVNYTIPPTLFTVLLLPKGQCFTATQTVTGPNGFIAINTARGCG